MKHLLPICMGGLAAILPCLALGAVKGSILFVAMLILLSAWLLNQNNNKS